MAWKAFATPRPAPLPDGRTIALHCAGAGAPIALLFAGAGDWADIWRPIVGPLAGRARVCAWDRPGYGFSSASPETQDVVHTERDLEAALRAAGLRPPFVLVAHSLGAYEALLFADRRPREVAGMVLVEPSFPDQDRLVRGSNPEAEAFMDQSLTDLVATERRCAAKLRDAPATGRPDPDCLTPPAHYSAALRRRLERLYADPARAMTRASFMEQMGRDSELVINPGRRYGAMPLTVLTAANDPSRLSDLPGSVKTFLATQWVAGHDALAALSSTGVNHVVAGTTHYIHVQKPAVVIAAVNQMLIDARQGSAHRGAVETSRH